MSSAYQSAVKELSRRREQAILENERRYREVQERLPQSRALLHQLSQTGRSIVQAVASGPEQCRSRIQQIMEENLIAQRKLAELLAEAGLPEGYLDVRYTCSLCEDTGYCQGKKCSCLRDLIVRYNTEAFGAQISSATMSFRSFSLRYYEEGQTRCVMEAILSFCRSYAESFEPHSPSVLMMGETGLGKTHLSLAIADAVMERGESVVYVSAPDLFRRLQNEYYGRGEPGADTMQALMDARLTIIDDLGAEIENQFNVSALYNLINSRLNLNRPVIISTNLMPKELERRYTNRIASRLMTMYKCLRFVGKDVRQIKLRNNEL